MTREPFEVEVESEDASQVGLAALLNGLSDTILNQEFDGERFRFKLSVEEKE